MPIVLYRIDDRLIHGQVVLGWGRTLGADFIVLVDDAVRRSEWEQELYRMAVPPDVEVVFSSVTEAAEALPGWLSDGRRGIVLTGDIATMVGLVQATHLIPRVNLGGIHFRPGRTERRPYVYLTDEEYTELHELADAGVKVSAQDVPTAAPVPLKALG
jgi:PTS system mannose-specific IIB component/fructoselysine and glucoselysine-specific PTS system IIB component